MEYQEIMWAEMKPDVYAGDNFDQIEPLWEAYSCGDMESDTFDSPIELCCKTFPPGTKVTISVPCCPKCGQRVEICKIDEYCGFDWDEWTRTEYS